MPTGAFAFSLIEKIPQFFARARYPVYLGSFFRRADRLAGVSQLPCLMAPTGWKQDWCGFSELDRTYCDTESVWMGICDTERRWYVFKIQLILEWQIALKTVSRNQPFTASGK